jgi:hypothetical protein
VDETTMWLIGLGITAAGGFLTIWWRVESRQDKALCALRKENDSSHKHLHGKVDRVQDKVEEIWKHLVREGKRR